MTTIYQIPLGSGAQQFTVDLGGTKYKIRLLYRKADGGGWFLDLYDARGNIVLAGLPLRPGHDLLEPYQYLGIGHLYVAVDGGAERDPDYSDMGSAVSLYYKEP